LIQGSSEVLLSVLPSRTRDEAAPAAALVRKARSTPASTVPVRPKPGKHVKKGYGVGDRRALDRLFEATGNGGSGKP